MPDNLFDIFFICFFSISVCHALLASTSKILFAKKPWGRLSHNQLKVLQGEATISQRAGLFFHTLFISLFTPIIYGLTIVACLLYYAYQYLT